MAHLPELVASIQEQLALLQGSQAELEERAVAAAKAEDRAKRAWASAFLEAEGPVAEREARADLMAADPRYEARLADALARSALEAVRSLRQGLSALQTITAALRAEAEIST